MLIFTNEQQTAIMAARAGFNTRATAMAAGIVAGLEGNSLAIPLDAWRRIDTRVQQISRTRLQMFNRLAAASTIPVSIADLVNFYPQVSDSGEVLVTMDGRNAAKADQAVVKYAGTPVPILNSTARFGWRQMEVIRKGGGMIDTATIGNHQRKVAEKLEDMVLNGLSGIEVDGNVIYGLRNLPARNTFVHGFTLATATGAQWLSVIKQAIAAAMGDNQYGQVTLFVNQADYTAADTTDYAANYSGTILQRLNAVNQIKEIVPVASVPPNEVLGIVDIDGGEWGGILSAMPVVTRPKNRIEPEDDYLFSVMAAAAPQFRSDYIGQSAFLHGTQA
ncbi:bacteriocin family protein [Acidovorax sp. Be4]|uniref:Bacteriocin family protein n=1 Tax=Acidovorax bellezanensis TaxID=2976702 RepID=A0ABT2PPM9_9BURK|nr:bacteriocin family protein [Acidovorax sp. Be4]MCT9812425.1 bacteriocin family protein [Acidovorax sp. Be4]